MSDTPFVVQKVEWFQFRPVVDDSTGHAFGCARLERFAARCGRPAQDERWIHGRVREAMRHPIRTVVFAGLLLVQAHVADAEPKKVQVYKSPTCGCCQKWVDHLKTNGFTVDVSNLPDVNPVKRDVGVPEGAASCHTAIVDGYFIEGHVPAEDVARLLAEHPKDVVGLAVPGMPVGSPGMEGPNAEKYSVLAVRKDGKLKVFASHGP